MKETTMKTDTIKVNDALAEAIANRLKIIDLQSQALNAYVQGIADTLEVPAGWEFDRNQMAFVNPPKGDDQ